MFSDQYTMKLDNNNKDILKTFKYLEIKQHTSKQSMGQK